MTKVAGSPVRRPAARASRSSVPTARVLPLRAVLLHRSSRVPVLPTSGRPVYRPALPRFPAVMPRYWDSPARQQKARAGNGCISNARADNDRCRTAVRRPLDRCASPPLAAKRRLAWSSLTVASAVEVAWPRTPAFGRAIAQLAAAAAAGHTDSFDRRIAWPRLGMSQPRAGSEKGKERIVAASLQVAQRRKHDCHNALIGQRAIRQP